MIMRYILTLDRFVGSNIKRVIRVYIKFSLRNSYKFSYNEFMCGDIYA